MKLRYNIFTLSLFFGLLLYLIDALMDSVIFHTGTFWSSLFAGVPVHEIRERMVMVGGFLAFGIIVSRILAGRRRAEEALREAHERAIWLARFPEENPNPVARASVEGKVLYRNSAAAKLPGWACQVGEPLPEPLLGLVAQAMTERQETHQDVDLGGRFYFVSVAPFPQEFYANVYGHEITQRKRAEEESKAILRTAMDGFWLTDAHGHFLDVNNAYSHLTGYSRDELLTMRIHDVEAAETSEETEEHIRNIKEVGEGRFETRHRRKDGSIVDLEVSVNYMEPGGGRFFVFLRDITEHKRAEEALAERTVQLERTNRELVALNAELDDFTNVASHDLQEPLRTLAAFSAMLRKDLDQSLPERAAQDIGFITDAARRMQTLIQDLLALSRAGRVAKKREKVSLGECADLALEALAMRMKETGAQVTRDELPEVWGDSTLLTQLYQNLIGNALKFCGDQPPVIRLTAEERDGPPVFGVKDNGIGIESKYAQQIFQPFRRLHGRAEYEGSGIGLAICRKIVERHGGKIWVDSEPGKGAHFRFRISHRRRE